ncbi:hypothetical protein [Phaeodactylibacter xiamenensis]|uniref:hypothetical protein n=1 Tax=Phaeodactylibacter xiamenensis TaxID=1524460 RepID=UPI003CCB7C37
MKILPQQNLPRSKKDKEWKRACVDALVNSTDFSVSGRRNYIELYKAYRGDLDEDAYSYMLNPYNTNRDEHKAFPARLRNYNIIKPIIDLFMGEKAKRPFKFMTSVTNDDVYSLKMEEQKRLMDIALQQVVINKMNEMGIPTGVESNEDQTPERVKEFMEKEYQDPRAIRGQRIVNELMKDCDLVEKFQRLFFNALVAGFTVSYKGAYGNQVIYEDLNPEDIDYAKSPDLTYLEDADWVVANRKMTKAQIYDRFYDDLEEEDIEWLEKRSISTPNVLEYLFRDREDKRKEIGEAELYNVYHVVWKSRVKIGELTYYDEFGLEQTMEVDETYKPDKDAGESVRWIWVNEVWEGWRIEDQIYLGIKPLRNQRRSMDNPSEAKLPYNGRVDIMSIAELGLNYQILYNILHYRVELSIAKNKDKIALVEINTIPKRGGWDPEKFMYYADANGYMFVDSTQTGARNEKVPFNQYQVLDMSLGKYIAEQINIMNAVKEEWEELVGVPRYRKGQVMASDSVGTTERAVFQSSVITEEMFRKFERFLEKELEGLIDMARTAWKNGRRISYIDEEYNLIFDYVDGDEFQETNYGIRVVNSSSESEKVERIREIALALAQNGEQPDMIAAVIGADNYAMIKEKLTEYVKKREQAQQRAEQAQKELAQIAEDAETQRQQAEHDLKRELKQVDKEIAMLKIDADRNGIPDIIEGEKLALEREKAEMDYDVKKEKNQIEREKLEGKPN